MVVFWVLLLKISGRSSVSCSEVEPRGMLKLSVLVIIDNFLWGTCQGLISPCLKHLYAILFWFESTQHIVISWGLLLLTLYYILLPWLLRLL